MNLTQILLSSVVGLTELHHTALLGITIAVR